MLWLMTFRWQLLANAYDKSLLAQPNSERVCREGAKKSERGARVEFNVEAGKKSERGARVEFNVERLPSLFLTV